jgi:NADH-quinone oxidoreductase subunit C
MALETVIQDKLTAAFGKFTSSKKKDIFRLKYLLTKLQRLFSFKNDPLLRFNFLTDLCGIHYPDNEVDRQFTIVYHMHNWYENKRIKIKTFINGEKPEIKPFLTFSSVQTGWKEKPMILRCRFWTQLKRILNMDENGFVSYAKNSYGRWRTNR